METPIRVGESLLADCVEFVEGIDRDKFKVFLGDLRRMRKEKYFVFRRVPR